MSEHNKPKECEIGENLAEGIALLGCYLMQEGVVRKKKEKIKDYVAQVASENMKNQKQSLLLCSRKGDKQSYSKVLFFQYGGAWV